MNKQDNVIIAEFMGLVLVTLDKIKTNKKPYISSADGYTDDELKYDCSWDWLIPVVEKIEIECQGVPTELLYCSLYSDIKEVYQSVVKFIKRDYE